MCAKLFHDLSDVLVALVIGALESAGRDLIDTV